MNVAETTTIGTNTYEAIRKDIIFGRLIPSEKLKLEAIKKRYNTSVSTLREVLSRLTSEGFVVAEGQKGFVVAPMSNEDLEEIADLRILLECHALKLSFEAGDTDWEGKVVAAHHMLSRMEEKMLSGDISVREEWKRYDWQFHQALILACGSTQLLNTHGTVFDKYLRYQMRTLTFRGEQAASEHREFLSAALDRDVDKAQAVLRKHIMGGVKHSHDSQQNSDK